ncbi:hypothetical protein HELRODRAFT_121903, partial [Helobdella robusta]|uniref:G-protein coupled receptors family 1 profile domain-containing protein n=1 Tax=Helobdella robusta TaxID=6412 RepID=T1EGT1_HELRO
RSASRVNIFIINLAVGDLTVLSFTMTTELLFVVLNQSWTLGNVVCKAVLYIQIITLASTTFILTAMSVDRYLAICRPLKINSLNFSPRKMIILSWTLALVFASPQLFIFKQSVEGVYPDGRLKLECASKGYTEWWQRKMYFTFMTAYILLIPCFVISFCYINVARIVWRQTNIVHLKQVKNNSKLQSGGGECGAKLKTIKMSLSIICVFVVCWTPYFVVHLVYIWSEYTYKIPKWLFACADTTAFLNSALNPIIYGFFNVKFRKRKSN